jgi:hypothetical protein
MKPPSSADVSLVDASWSGEWRRTARQTVQITASTQREISKTWE